MSMASSVLFEALFVYAVLVSLVCLRLLQEKLRVERKEEAASSSLCRLETEVARLRKEVKTERASAEALKRQAENQASMFETIIYENASLKDQIRSQDQRLLSSKKQS